MGIEEPSKHSGIVIVGAGLAGWHVIDAIRSKDKEIPITLITADNADRYHKPMLTMAISPIPNHKPPTERQTPRLFRNNFQTTFL